MGRGTLLEFGCLCIVLVDCIVHSNPSAPHPVNTCIFDIWLTLNIRCFIEIYLVCDTLICLICTFECLFRPGYQQLHCCLCMLGRWHTSTTTWGIWVEMDDVDFRYIFIICHANSACTVLTHICFHQLILHCLCIDRSKLVYPTATWRGLNACISQNDRSWEEVQGNAVTTRSFSLNPHNRHP